MVSTPNAARAARRNRSRPTSERLEQRQLLAAHIVGSAAVYATVQAAIDAATPGSTVTVDAGTYAGPITVNKTLTLLGANAGVDARGTRKAESIVTTTATGITIAANDVTLDGFDVVGTKADVGGALAAGVVLGPSIHGSHIVNDIIADNVSGLYLSNNSDTDAALIQHDWFYDNYETDEWFENGWNGSRQIYTDGEVSGGLLTNVLIDSNLFSKDADITAEPEIGLQAASAGKQFNITISNNVFDANGFGAKAVLAFNVTNLTIVGNDIYGHNDGGSGGLRFEGNDHNVDIEYNSIHDNLGPGIVTDASGAASDSDAFVVRYNDIYNDAASFNNIGLISGDEQYDGLLVATNNWWGSASGPSGDGPGTGQAVWADGTTGHFIVPTGLPGGSITFTPWATSLIPITGYGVPTPPTSLTASLSGATSVTLSWTASISTATSQLVQRSTDGVTFTTIATVSPLVNAYADAGLSAGTGYTYRVIAANTYGNSTASNTSKATVTGTGGGTVALSALAWTTASAGWGTTLKNLSVGGNTLTVGGKAYASGIGTHAVSTIAYALGGAYGTFAATVGVDAEVDPKGVGSVDFKVVGDGVTLFDSGVMTNDQAKSFTVSVAGVKTLQLLATNGVANSIDYDHADWAGATLSTAALAVPAAPAGLTAAALTATSVKLAWTAAASVSSYAVDRSTNGTTWITITLTVAGSATTWTDPTVLTANTKYDYRIRAVNSAGTSANSAIATVTTPANQTVTNLSSLTWVSATAGWGTVQKNLSVGGNALKLGTTTYATGIGTHATSTIVYNLAGAYTTFVSTVGVDAEEDGKGTGHADFKVYGDGVLLYDSGVLTNDQTAALAVSVVGVKQLMLVVTPAADGDIDYAHADWAGAQLLS